MLTNFFFFDRDLQEAEAGDFYLSANAFKVLNCLSIYFIPIVCIWGDCLTLRHLFFLFGSFLNFLSYVDLTIVLRSIVLNEGNKTSSVRLLCCIVVLRWGWFYLLLGFFMRMKTVIYVTWFYNMNILWIDQKENLFQNDDLFANYIEYIFYFYVYLIHKLSVCFKFVFVKNYAWVKNDQKA